MKKYLQPELTISLFDVEDVITASGVVSSTGYEQAAAAYGTLYTDAAMQNPTNASGNAIYFTWN